MRRLAAILFALACWASVVRAESASTHDAAFSKAIDARIDAVLKDKSIKSSKRAEQHELLRRIYLDLIGRTPTPDESSAYLSDSDPDKHHKLIDALLTDPEMPVHWRGVINHWLNGMLPEKPPFQDRFLEYLQTSLEQNKPWDRIARELLSPGHEDESVRNAALFISSRLKGDKQEQLDNITTAVASVFFGVQLQCAKCHDHPFVLDWTQEHYYGLAAFFSRTEQFKYKDASVLSERAEGELTFVTTEKQEKTARLMFLDGKVIEEPDLGKDVKDRYLHVKGQGGKPGVPKFSRRGALVDYAIGGKTPYLQRSIANRIWKKLMGRGLVEPVDQMHPQNPPTHPALLNLLAEDTQKHGFDLRRLISGIMHSETYLRSTRWRGDSDRPDNALYAVAVLKPLTPNQLAHSLGIATGHLDQLQAKYEREKSKRKLPTVTRAVTRALFERERDFDSFQKRFESGGARFQANASQALFLTYNDTTQRMLRPAGDNLVARLTKLEDSEQRIRAAYLAVFSRQPDDQELSDLKGAASGEDNTELQRSCQDLVWTLIASAEFRFNH